MIERFCRLFEINDSTI